MIPLARRALGGLAIGLAALPLVSGLPGAARGLDAVTGLDLISPLPSLDLPLPSEDLISPLPTLDLGSPLPTLDLGSPLPTLDLGSPLPTLDLGSPLPSAPTGLLPTQEPSGAAAPSVQGGAGPPLSLSDGGVGSAVTGSRAIVPEAPPLATVLPGESWLVPALSVAVPVLIVGALVVLQVLGGAAALQVARVAFDRLGAATPPWLREDGPAP